MRLSRDRLLRDMFQAALDAADPGQTLAQALPPRPTTGRILVLGAGKATARMAQALEAAWGPLGGLIAVPHGAGLPLEGIELIETSHPVPDAASAEAARRMLDLAEGCGAGDTVIALVSGGGSALLAAPRAPVTLEDKQAVARALLACGAPIDQMNIVRQQLSDIKGGGLARAAAPARVLTYVVSDVPGDDPALVASGPTIGARGTAAEALAILKRHGITPPEKVLTVLEGAARDIASDAGEVEPEVHVIASAQGSLVAAAEVARRAGYQPMILGDALEGEAAEMGRVLAGIARQVRTHGQPGPMPLALISGGEATVTVRPEQGKPGRGGRCSEFLLAFALASGRQSGLAALACDTDGRDGSEHNAGAIWHGDDPFDRAAARDHLARHDAYGFFETAGGVVETGPTHTNVNDFRAILID